MRASRGRKPGQTIVRQTASQLSPDSHRRNRSHAAHSEINKAAPKETSKEESSSDESDGPGQLEEDERAAAAPAVAGAVIDLDATPDLEPEGQALTEAASEDRVSDTETSEEESCGALMPTCSAAAAASSETKTGEAASLRRRKPSKFALAGGASIAASAGIFGLASSRLGMPSPEKAADTAAPAAALAESEFSNGSSRPSAEPGLALSTLTF